MSVFFHGNLHLLGCPRLARILIVQLLVEMGFWEESLAARGGGDLREVEEQQSESRLSWAGMSLRW